MWLVALLALVLIGNVAGARELAAFIPDCVTLFRRLIADERVPRKAKLMLWLLIAYLALPFDVVPDFIPVVGQLDDALVVAAALAFVARSTSRELVEELWPGSRRRLRLVLLFVRPLRRGGRDVADPRE